MTYEVKPGISKNIALVVTCTSCFQPMESVYSYNARHTCHECGGSALMDSKEALEIRRRDRERKSKIDRENERLLKQRQ